MDINSLAIDVIENVLSLTINEGEPVLVPLSEAHNRLEIQRGSFAIRTCIRIHPPGQKSIQFECDAGKAVELSAKLVSAWFAVPRIYNCKRVASMSLGKPQMVELNAIGLVLINGDKRTVVKPEYLMKASLDGTAFATARTLTIPNVASLIFPNERQTIFWLNRYVEAWTHASIEVPRRVNEPGVVAEVSPQVTFSAETAVQRDRETATRKIATGLIVCIGGVIVTAVT